MRTGTADLPLHGGRAPRWLFERMTSLAREMTLAMLAEEGAPGLLRRLADPMVPGLRLRARVRLAHQWPDHDRLRRPEGGVEGSVRRDRDRRGRRQGEDV